jgi:hypothetical protein
MTSFLFNYYMLDIDQMFDVLSHLILKFFYPKYFYLINNRSKISSTANILKHSVKRMDKFTLRIRRALTEKLRVFSNISKEH